ncbi:MAG: hypothetical protein AAF403_04935, partial [Pseudomonadota bacterium]
MKFPFKNIESILNSNDLQTQSHTLKQCREFIAKHKNALNHKQYGFLLLCNVALSMKLEPAKTALKVVEDALSFYPDRQDLLINHAILIYNEGLLDQAEIEFTNILSTFSKSWITRFYLMQIMADQKRLDEAVILLQQTPELNLEKHETHLSETFCTFCEQASKILRGKNKYKLAASFVSSGLRQNLTHYRLLQERAINARWLGQYQESLNCYAMMKMLKHHDPNYYNNRALVYENMRQYDLALKDLEHTIKNPKFDPDSKIHAYWLRASLHLRTGRFKQGWADNIKRWQRPDHAMQRCKQGFKEWDGQPLNQRSIYLYQEQGYGDIIQFCRFANLLKQKDVAHIYIETQPGLERLLSSLKCAERVFSVTDPVKPKADLQCPIIDLPYFLDISDSQNIPFSEGYLKAPFSIKIKRDPRIPSVGLVWSGNPEQPIGYWRDMKLDDLKPLFELTHLQYVNLSRDIEVSGFKGHPSQNNMIDLSSYMQDFALTAALLEHVDLVITTCTAMAHLAGSIGKECWVMLATNPSWVWLDEGTKSAWYKSVRLYRQKNFGRWDEVVEDIKKDLYLKYPRK